MTEMHLANGDTVKVHPAAALFPMMSDAELDELAADIAKNGLQESITLWTPDRKSYELPEENFLLDGRNRLRAIERAFDDPNERDAALKAALNGGIKIFGVPIALRR